MEVHGARGQESVSPPGHSIKRGPGVSPPKKIENAICDLDNLSNVRVICCHIQQCTGYMLSQTTMYGLYLVTYNNVRVICCYIQQCTDSMLSHTTMYGLYVVTYNNVPVICCHIQQCTGYMLSHTTMYRLYVVTYNNVRVICCHIQQCTGYILLHTTMYGSRGITPVLRHRIDINLSSTD